MKPQWNSKERALMNYCKKHAIDYVVLTEKDVDLWLEQLKG